MKNTTADLWLGGPGLGVSAMDALAVILPHTNLQELKLAGAGELPQWSSQFIDAIEHSTLTNIYSHFFLHGGATAPRLVNAVTRAINNRRLLAFVSGYTAKQRGRKRAREDHSPVSNFLEKDGDFALGHRVAWFLIG